VKRWIEGALLGATLAGAGAILYASQVERGDVQLDRFTVEIDRPGVPPGGITVLHLSDFHFRAGDRPQARKIARLRRLLVGERYDIVALTGDLIHDMAGFPVVLALIESLRPRLGAFSCPGNHDYAEYSVWGMFGEDGQASGEIPAANGKPAPLGEVVRLARKLADYARKVVRNELVRLPLAFNDVAAMNAALAARGVQPLINRAVRVQADGVDMWVAGVDDQTEGQPDLGAAIATVPEDPPLILLAHNPDIWLDPRVGQADLVLSGHSHGGR
jgi:predicted MPP superfamily phosphohydrolase